LQFQFKRKHLFCDHKAICKKQSLSFSSYHVLIIVSDEKLNISIPTNIAYVNLPTSFFQCGTQFLRSLDSLKTITKVARTKTKGEPMIRDFCYGCREEKCCKHA